MFFSGYLSIKSDYDLIDKTKTYNIDSFKVYNFAKVDINTNRKLTIFNQQTTIAETQIGDSKSIFKLNIDQNRTREKLTGFVKKTPKGKNIIILNHKNETKV
jgi:hypothetical protein